MLSFQDRRNGIGLSRTQAAPAHRVDDVVLQRRVQAFKWLSFHQRPPKELKGSQIDVIDGADSHRRTLLCSHLTFPDRQRIVFPRIEVVELINAIHYICH